MESHVEPGKIQVTESTYVLLNDEFQFAERGVIDVKRKGNLKTWWSMAKK